MIIRDLFQTVWACNLCKKKQDLLAKTGTWYHGGMARPVALDIGDVASGSESGSIKAEVSPSSEKRTKMTDKQDGRGMGSDKEIFDRQKNSFSRAGSLQGKELKRQFSMSDAINRGLGQASGHQQPTSSGGQTGPVGPSSSGSEKASEQEKPKDHGQTPDRGRGRDRGSAKQRFHSESRLSETDRRYGGDFQQHQERDRHHGSNRRDVADRDKGPAFSHKSGQGDEKKGGEHGVHRGGEQDARDIKDRHR